MTPYQELIESAKELEALMPEDEIVLALAPDSGLGIRKYPLDRGLTDAQIVKFRSAISRASAHEEEITRLTDLVRYMRHELFDAKLIREKEYAALVADSDGGQRVARLESYDATVRKLAEIRKLLARPLPAYVGLPLMCKLEDFEKWLAPLKEVLNGIER